MTIKVRGLKELEKQLIALGSKDGTRILRRAMFLAGEPIEERAEQRAAAIPNGSGAIKQSITKRVSKGLRSYGLPELGSRFVTEIYPRAKDRVALALHNLFYQRKRRGIFYGHLLEFGHKTRDGKEVGSRKIFEPALRSGAGRAIVTLAREVRAGIERQLRRNAR